jgi:wyosine [tRNA(Phe)-imidazoG37] synthetase (radical SAM superfamily)
MPGTRKDNAKMMNAWQHHERRWKDNLYVYAVVSRRSRGISIGINLSPDKRCNFDCVYCQVNRSMPPQTRKVDLERLKEELDSILQSERDRSLYLDEPYNALSPAEYGVHDIAFSGDGEPTAFPRFIDAVNIAVEAQRRFQLDAAKLVLITNAGFLNKPEVRAALVVMDENNGEIWAKLDAGTEEYFRLVNGSTVPLQKILNNILCAARVRPVLIQSLWFRSNDVSLPVEEIDAYCRNLNDILSAGGHLKSLQLYTIARDPADPSACALSDKELDNIASMVKSRVPVPIEVFYSGKRS